MIYDCLVVVTDLGFEKTLKFTSFTRYREWEVEQAKFFLRPWLNFRNKKERKREEKLELRYDLPEYTLRGAFLATPLCTVETILRLARKRRKNLSQTISELRVMTDVFPPTEPIPITLPIQVNLETGCDEMVYSPHSFYSYNEYFRWKLDRARIIDRWSMIKADRRQRHRELLLEERFGQPRGHFRGIFAIDYRYVIPRSSDLGGDLPEPPEIPRYANYPPPPPYSEVGRSCLC